MNVSGTALSELLLAFTDLYLLLSKRDTADDINSCSFVGLGITLVLGFKDRLIFGAAEVVSQHSTFFSVGKTYLVRRRFCRTRGRLSMSGRVFWLTES